MYERKQDNQVFYVLLVECILGKLPVVPVGDTGTIPYSMRQHAADFVGAAFDTREGAGDGSRVVVHQHLGLELVPRTRREMKKPSLISCLL